MVQIAIRGDSLVKIVASIEAAIRAGRLAPGERLPSVRGLAKHLELSPATVAGAYRQLQRRGLVVTEGRRGTMVSHRPPLPLPLPGDFLPEAVEGVRDCASGNPDPALLPDIGPALGAVRRRHMLYDDDPNDRTLVDLARAQFEADGVAAERMCMVNGSLDGIERALSESLVGGDRVVVEDPCFTGVLDLVRARGLVPVPVAVDDAGMLPEPLAKALAMKPKALLVTPRAQNPTGAALTADRAAALRVVLSEVPELLVIEDDYEGAISGVPYVGLCEGRRRWTVVRSLSKSFGPDLRLALLAGDEVTLAHIQGRQVLGMRWVSHWLQDMAVHFLQSDETKRVLERAAETYARRRRALLEALAERGVRAHGRSGFNVWVPVPDEAIMAQHLLQAGWLVRPGQRYRLASAPAIRVTTAALPAAEAVCLADAIAAVLHGGARRSLV